MAFAEPQRPTWQCLYFRFFPAVRHSVNAAYLWRRRIHAASVPVNLTSQLSPHATHSILQAAVQLRRRQQIYQFAASRSSPRI